MELRYLRSLGGSLVPFQPVLPRKIAALARLLLPIGNAVTGQRLLERHEFRRFKRARCGRCYSAGFVLKWIPITNPVVMQDKEAKESIKSLASDQLMLPSRASWAIVAETIRNTTAVAIMASTA